MVRVCVRFVVLLGVCFFVVVLPLFAFVVHALPPLPRFSVHVPSVRAVATVPVVPSSLSGSCFDLARSEALRAGINPELYVRQINQESGCQPTICSSAGACGVAQLMPATAAGLGVSPFDMQASLWAGAHLMAGYLHTYAGDWAKALACYNAGSGATAYVISTYGSSWYAYLPVETQHYILVILGHF